MRKVETAIDPYALLRNFNILLGVDGPGALRGNPLSLFRQLFGRAVQCGGRHVVPGRSVCAA